MPRNIYEPFLAPGNGPCHCQCNIGGKDATEGRRCRVIAAVRWDCESVGLSQVMGYGGGIGGASGRIAGRRRDCGCGLFRCGMVEVNFPMLIRVRK
jgi:hypothetical protein